MPDRSNSLIELTIFTKGARLGALTKTIKLVNDKPESDSKDCRMWSGKARRARITDLDGFKAVIENSQADRGDRNRPDETEAWQQGHRRRGRHRRQEN